MSVAWTMTVYCWTFWREKATGQFGVGRWGMEASSVGSHLGTGCLGLPGAVEPAVALWYVAVAEGVQPCLYLSGYSHFRC